jgi:hypothetical protein
MGWQKTEACRRCPDLDLSAIAGFAYRLEPDLVGRHTSEWEGMSKCSVRDATRLFGEKSHTARFRFGIRIEASGEGTVRFNLEQQLRSTCPPVRNISLAKLANWRISSHNVSDMQQRLQFFIRFNLAALRTKDRPQPTMTPPVQEHTLWSDGMKAAWIDWYSKRDQAAVKPDHQSFYLRSSNAYSNPNNTTYDLNMIEKIIRRLGFGSPEAPIIPGMDVIEWQVSELKSGSTVDVLCHKDSRLHVVSFKQSCPDEKQIGEVDLTKVFPSYKAQFALYR